MKINDLLKEYQGLSQNKPHQKISSTIMGLGYILTGTTMILTGLTLQGAESLSKMLQTPSGNKDLADKLFRKIEEISKSRKKDCLAEAANAATALMFIAQATDITEKTLEKMGRIAPDITLTEIFENKYAPAEQDRSEYLKKRLNLTLEEKQVATVELIIAMSYINQQNPLSETEFQAILKELKQDQIHQLRRKKWKLIPLTQRQKRMLEEATK